MLWIILQCVHGSIYLKLFRSDSNCIYKKYRKGKKKKSFSKLWWDSYAYFWCKRWKVPALRPPPSSCWLLFPTSACCHRPRAVQHSPTQQSSPIAGEWIRRGALEVSGPSPAHPTANFKLGQACPGSSLRNLPRVEISQPLGAWDATQLLCHDENVFLGNPLPG